MTMVSKKNSSLEGRYLSQPQRQRNNKERFLSRKNNRFFSSSKRENTIEKEEYPSSLVSSTEATLAYVKPGNCQLESSNFTKVSLFQRWRVSPTSYVLRFGPLPNPNSGLNLSTCACILAKANIGDEEIIRPYTPISTNAQMGTFDLLIKDYGANDGMMSHYLCNTLQEEEEEMEFKHIDFNVKLQYPDIVDNNYDHIGMIVGGTGITPMIQLLHNVLGDDDDKKKTKITMLYGSRTSNDILGNDLLNSWMTKYSDRLRIVHVLSDEDGERQQEQQEQEYHHGFIDKELITKHFPTPYDDNNKSLVVVCGPPILYDIMCGPRDQTDTLSGILHEMGYSIDHVYKF